MKITMQMTVADLIQTLRWQAIELAEDANARSGKDQAANSKRKPKATNEAKP
ncbi:hypothetical protein J2X72_002559 [Phyllobacterium sp. 1468]|uniref:hypothetical protein n=1 Tax=Phyllobacterium sp. 1468 TaxID=2817759 RepID=UPI00285D4DE6|nr:hypothetical protein [Phyllobacterium sp. 1468]MDR6633759.1 hypothetical protein [Phyllobacterium sp. 1468]